MNILLSYLSTSTIPDSHCEVIAHTDYAWVMKEDCVSNAARVRAYFLQSWKLLIMIRVSLDQQIFIGNPTATAALQHLIWAFYLTVQLIYRETKIVKNITTLEI